MGTEKKGYKCDGRDPATRCSHMWFDERTTAEIRVAEGCPRCGNHHVYRTVKHELEWAVRCAKGLAADLQCSYLELLPWNRDLPSEQWTGENGEEL